MFCAPPRPSQLVPPIVPKTHPHLLTTSLTPPSLPSHLPSRHEQSRVRPSPWRWSLRTPSTTSRPRSRTRRASPGSAAPDLRGQAARDGRTRGLQHPEGVHPAPRAPSSAAVARSARRRCTKPKKVKHVHKKVKLAFLKLYKVDDAGKVTRLRGSAPPRVRRRRLHGQPLRPPLLRQVRPHLRLPEVNEGVQSGVDDVSCDL